MLTAKQRPLQFPLDEQVAIVVDSDGEAVSCETPQFPEDSDERITVFLRLSLNEYVTLASAVDVGSDIAYGQDAIKVWEIWTRVLMCAQFCDEVAECLTSENPAVVAALANLIANNPTILQAISDANAENGGSTPGQPISEEQAGADALPGNVKDEEGNCLPDPLWGGILYMVQSGNRAVTDVFEIIESASNTLENMEIISRNIPAAGDYIATAAAFADQLQEVIAEGYAAAYTETYEENLSCDIFCVARAGCALSVDDLMTVMNNRLSAPMDLGDFGEIMAGIATGTWVGDDIANVAFLLFFAALRFGQQFGGTVGIRPLDILMSLGADQLASNNWMALCDCPDLWAWTFPTDEFFTAFNANEFHGSTCVINDETIEAVDAVTDPGNMYADFSIVVDGTVTRIDYHFTTDVGMEGAFQYNLYIDGTLQESVMFEGDGSYVGSWSGSSTGSHTYRFLTGINGTSGAGNSIVTTEIEWFGTDDNPFD